MMRFKSLIAAAALAVLPVFASAATPVVQWAGVGSSGQWQSFGIGAYALAASEDTSGTPGHFTVKGTCNADCADGNDSRSSSISLQSGNLWVVWTNDHSKVWAGLSVDSIVGDRLFFAVPRATLLLDTCYDGTAYLTSCAKAAAGNTNLISSAFLGSTTDTTSLPSDIFAALQGTKFTAAMTDIRPEDALFEQQRVVSAEGATLTGTTSAKGLGYGTGPNTLVGTSILDSVSGSAQPVAFALSGGKDPFTGQTVPASNTIDVGAGVIVFFVNRHNTAGLGASATAGKTLSQGGVPKYPDIPGQVEQAIFSGTSCVIPSTTIPIHVFMREPLSGTMTTTEFSITLSDHYTAAASQESNITASTEFKLGAWTNTGAALSPYVQYQPASNSSGGTGGKTCVNGKGDRSRAVGTGNETKAVEFVTDALGYNFFGYGNFSAIANNPLYGYVTLHSTDPIKATYTNGQFPACPAAGCPATPGSSFPNVRNGKYDAWGVLRVVTDAKGTTNYTNTAALVVANQNHNNSTVPDFIPVAATTDGDPGLTYYRSHYTQSGVAPNNGLLAGSTESGGDVGGTIEKKPTSGAGVLNSKDYK
jgi:hypothetical protein